MSVSGDVFFGWKMTGHLEDHPPGDLHGVIGEALVEPAEQRHIDGCGDTVLPLLVHHHAEQVAVQIIHRVVVLADLSRLVRVP